MFHSKRVSTAAWMTMAFIMPLGQSLSTTTPQKRVPWDGLRFLQQSSKFISLPSWFVPQSTKGTVVVSPGDVLWSVPGLLDADVATTKTKPPKQTNTFTMAPLDDVVMGGASASTFDDSTGIWSAMVTDANNGGFVGLRSTPLPVPYDVSACQGLLWELRLEEGTKITRQVKFVLRDSTAFNGVTHTYIATLKPGRNTVKIPFAKLVPARFATVLNDVTFQKENLSGVQITYSKFEFDGKLSKGFVPGELRLQLLSLKAY